MPEHFRHHPHRGALHARLVLAGALAATAGLGAFPAAALAEPPSLAAPAEQATDPGSVQDETSAIAPDAAEAQPVDGTEAQPTESTEVQPTEGADADPAPIGQDPAPQSVVEPEPVQRPAPRPERATANAVDPATVVATASVEGPGGPNWFHGPATVTVSAPPEAFGVAYRVDSGSWVETTSTLDATVVVDGEGAHTVAYRAIVGDPGPQPTLQAAGFGPALLPGLEYGPTGSLSVGVDTTAPAITGLPNAFGKKLPSFVTGQRVRFDYRCGDALSGVVTCDSSPKAGGLLPTADPGEHAVRISARDRAGNSTVRIVHYRVVEKPTSRPKPKPASEPEPRIAPHPGDDSETLAMTGAAGASSPGPLLAAVASLLGATVALGGAVRTARRR